MCSKCGRWMEEKKRAVPREVCTKRFERDNCYRKVACDRKGYWFNAGGKAVNWALSKERLINWGFYDLATAYQSLHVNY